MCAYGQRVARDGVEPARWYRNAADAGFGHGTTNLGMYENGRGVAAREWYEKAAAAGDPEAKLRFRTNKGIACKVDHG
jgi:TPR repeat protein